MIGGETVSMAPMASIGAEILGKPERRTKMGKRTIVTEKQLQRIAAADPKESCTSIGARIGLDAKVVDYQRRKLRKALVKPSPALHSLLTEPSVIELVQPENNEAATSNAEMRVESARTATVTLSVSEKSLDAWWATLELSEKAEIFRESYEDRWATA